MDNDEINKLRSDISALKAQVVELKGMQDEDRQILRGLIKELQTSSFKKLIEPLDQHIKAVEQDLHRLAKTTHDYNGLTEKHIALVERDVVDAFDRIKNMEFTIFPNLAKDIVDVYRITGEGENKAHNPLDHRKPPDSNGKK